MPSFRHCLLLLILCLLPLQSGCVVTAVGLAAAGVATAKQSMEDVVERSYPQPYWCVYKATHAAMQELAIHIEKVEQDEKGDTIQGKTAEYPVSIEVSHVTDSVTKVRIDAGKNIFQQDQATATAVADAIHDIIDRNLQAGLVIPPPLPCTAVSSAKQAEPCTDRADDAKDNSLIFSKN
ncbi:DUF3568 domain-containing protein [Desulfovibrio mangrovi]|uniref:DUF3568 family protein n=1 Tax=Desulfovibrio mangrovi TaxID=2976983 RepID=UPI0022470972|nr:DUF3568 family protein [Desulfovibrio mangrovi]UZP66711.1 DUF3568 domain-containing protein [Desulfovibrio mangrovi]